MCEKRGVIYEPFPSRVTHSAMIVFVESIVEERTLVVMGGRLGMLGMARDGSGWLGMTRDGSGWLGTCGMGRDGPRPL